MWRKIFCIQRPVQAWLLYGLWLEIAAIMISLSWQYEQSRLILQTNLLRPAPVPDGAWWTMATSQMILWLGIGFALVHVRRYGVLTGLCIVFLALVILREIGIWVW